MIGLLSLLGFAACLVVLVVGLLYAHFAQRPPRRTAAFAIRNGLPVDPSERGLAFSSWRLSVATGVQLDVWDIRQHREHDLSDGRARPTIIMVHGWGASRIHMLQRIDSYLPHAARIVLYDLRGHGESSGVSTIGHHEHLDLLQLIDATGDDHIIIASYSMGARIALAAAAVDAADCASSPCIRGVIVQGVYGDFASSFRRRVRLLGLPMWPFVDVAVALLRLRLCRAASIHEHAAKCSCPVLFMHGEEDEICNPSDIEHAVNAAKDGVLHVFEDAGHSDLHTVDAERHDRLIAEFVERVMAGQHPRAQTHENRLARTTH